MLRNVSLIAGTVMCLAACEASKSDAVTGIYVDKSERVLHLVNGRRAIKTFNVDLGFAPAGDKRVEGDGRTPEGTYYIDRKNPRSKYHLSLGISYPDARDVAQARQWGKSPGSDIFIHGESRKNKNQWPDWTEGCIALKNHEIEELYRRVPIGTPITIVP